MTKHFATLALLAAAFGLQIGSADAATVLTDSAVFSANSEGNNWNGWIWNTQGKPADGPDRWNLYYSTSDDPTDPTFINSFNDTHTEIAIDMLPGVYDFLIYGESVTTSIDPLQHFVLNLYFNGNQAAPAISALTGPSCAGVCPAGHPNGLDLFGSAPQQEANTLSFTNDGVTVTVSAFNWLLGDGVDKVWSSWANDAPYSTGSGTPDFVGRLQLTVAPVAPVPVPAALPLLVAAIGSLALVRRRSLRR